MVNSMSQTPSHDVPIASIEKPQARRSRPVREVVVNQKQKEAAAVAAAAVAKTASKAARVGNRNAPTASHEYIIQMLLKLPGFSWEESRLQ